MTRSLDYFSSQIPALENQNLMVDVLAAIESECALGALFSMIV